MSPTRLRPFPVLVQHPSWYGDGETLDGFQGGLRKTNWRANDHEPSLRWWHHPVGNFGGRTTGVDGSSRPSQPQIQPILTNIDKTKVMASDGIACRILIQNEQLAQVNTFSYLGSLIREDGECATEFRTRLSRGQEIGASLQKIWKSHSIPISTKIRQKKR